MTKSSQAKQPPEQKGWSSHIAELAKTIVYAAVIALVPRIVLAQPFTIPSASMEPTLQQGDYILVSKFSYGWSRYSVPLSPPFGDGRLLGRPPKRGDVVIFRLPRNDRVDYVKRVIGLPGDTIQVRGGTVLINGEQASQQLTKFKDVTCPQGFGERTETPIYSERLPNGRSHPLAACFHGAGGANNTAVYTVPRNCYFVMGDNRDNSVDSRFEPADGPTTAEAQTSCPFDPRLVEALGSDEPGVGFVPFDNLVGRADLILFSWTPGASIFKPWTWNKDAALGRWFHLIT